MALLLLYLIIVKNGISSYLLLDHIFVLLMISNLFVTAGSLIVSATTGLGMDQVVQTRCQTSHEPSFST